MLDKFVGSMARLHQEESGEDLVEYVLVLAFVGLAVTAGMDWVARDVHRSLSGVSAFLAQRCKGR